MRCSPQQSEETLIVKIAVLDDWQDVARSSADWSRLAARADLAFFADAFRTEDEAAVALAEFDILLTMRERTAFPETLIRRLPKLRMISITGASNASLDVAACTRQGITVCNTAAAARALPTQRPNWRLACSSPPPAPSRLPTGPCEPAVSNVACRSGIGLSGKTLGIVGLGRLGARLARYAIALDINVIAWSPNLTEAKAREAAPASSANPI